MSRICRPIEPAKRTHRQIMKIFGHRGAAGLAPENTVQGMQTALGFEVDGVEFDVRCTRDHVPVLMHDETLDRTTTGSGRLSDFRWEEIQRLRIEPDEHVPALTEILSILQDACQINVEIKEMAACGPTVEVLREAIRESTVRPEQLLVTSFDAAQVQAVRAAEPQLPVGMLTRDLPDEEYWLQAAELGARSANIALSAVDTSFVRRAHEENLYVMVYTVNSREDANRLSDWGVDAIFTDVPDQLLSDTSPSE